MSRPWRMTGCFIGGILSACAPPAIGVQCGPGTVLSVNQCLIDEVDAGPRSPSPLISGLSPGSGEPGTRVIVFGVNLTGGNPVIGGAAASVSRNSGLQLETIVPAAAGVGAGTLTVTVPGFEAVSAAFTVLAASVASPPLITGVSPTSGAPGTSLAISGSGLGGPTSVTLGGVAAVVISSSPNSIVTEVPASAPSGPGSIIVTTSVAPPASFPFNVIGGPVQDVSIDGVTVPSPSKRAFITPPMHGGLNGAGPEVNAWAMPPARCATTPALTRSWQHNIDLTDYKSRNAFDFFVMQANEALSYRFTVGTSDLSGGFIYNDAANATVRPTFISITATPCDFNTAKLLAGPNRDPCYQTGLNGNSVNWANITGQLPLSYCRLAMGQTYYFNLRFQDARPVAEGGSPTTDSCLSGNCGGIVQVL